MKTDPVSHRSATPTQQAQARLTDPATSQDGPGRLPPPQTLLGGLPSHPTGAFAELPTEMIQFIATKLDPQSVVAFASTNSELLSRTREQVSKAEAAIKAEQAVVQAIDADISKAKCEDFHPLIWRIEKLPSSRRSALLLALFEKYEKTWFDDPRDREYPRRILGICVPHWTMLPPEQIVMMKSKLAMSELITTPWVNVKALAERYQLDDPASIEALELNSRTHYEEGETVDAAASRFGIRSHRGIEALKIRSAKTSAFRTDFRIDLAAKKFGITKPKTRDELERQFACVAARDRGYGKTWETVARETGLCTPVGLRTLREHMPTFR